MGRFADSCIGELSDADLDDYERLLEMQDHDLYLWVTEEAAIPPDLDTPVFRRLRAFHQSGKGVGAR